jgi:hypothetical protein
MCGISVIPVHADETDESNIIYNNIKFKITDDMDVNATQIVITSVVDINSHQIIKDKKGNDLKFEYKFKIKDYEIKEGRDITLRGSTYYKYIELNMPIDLSNIDKLSNKTYELKTDLITDESSSIKYEDIKPNKTYYVSGSTVVKEDSSLHNALSNMTNHLISIICIVLILAVICFIFKIAIDNHWIPAPKLTTDGFSNEFTINNKNNEDNNIYESSTEEKLSNNVPKKIVYMCPACGQNYINFKLDGFIPHCANCGDIMIKVGEV